MMCGLCLQEPMALITNWIIASVAFVLYYKLRPLSGDFVKNWRFFLISIGLSTFFGGLGHIFFQYTGFYGKIPSWVLGNLAAFFADRKSRGHLVCRLLLEKKKQHHTRDYAR